MGSAHVQGYPTLQTLAPVFSTSLKKCNFILHQEGQRSIKYFCGAFA